MTIERIYLDLKEAIRQGDVPQVRHILHSEQFDDVYMVIRREVKEGRMDMIKYLSQHIPKFNEQYIHGYDEDLLSYATFYGHYDIVRYLVEEEKADIHVKDDYAFRVAVNMHRYDLIYYYVERGAHVNAQQGVAIQLAVSANAKDLDVNLIIYLLDHGADGTYALSIAMDKKRKWLVWILLDYGANPTGVEDPYGWIHQWIGCRDAVHHVLHDLRIMYPRTLSVDILKTVYGLRSYSTKTYFSDRTL